MNTTCLLLQTTFLLCVLSTYCQAGKVSEYATLYDELFTDYNEKLLPVINASDITFIELSAELISVNNFNGNTGELSLTIVFTLAWLEERITWQPTDYGNVTYLVVAPEDVWHPQVFIRQSADRTIDICDTSYMMRLHHDGFIYWTPIAIIKITCSMDVTSFPFDKQTCSLTLVSSIEGYIYVNTTTVGTTYYMTNSQWELDHSSSFKNASGDFVDPLIMTIVLQRKSAFFVVYTVIPVLSIGVLNTLVFVMPASSGERTCVAITAFLSFIVYMQVINSLVPESSDPIPNIYYYLLFLMIYSSSTMLLCITSLRIYDKCNDVPIKVRRLMSFLTFRFMRGRETEKLHTTLEADFDEGFPEHASNLHCAENHQREIDDSNIDINNTNIDDITWELVGTIFDRYCFIIMNLVFICSTVITFINLKNNTYYV